MSPAARRFTAPRTCTVDMVQKAIKAAGRKINNASIMPALSPKRSRMMFAKPSMVQILKFTMRYMMKFPIPIQLPAMMRQVLVRSCCQTLP